MSQSGLGSRASRFVALDWNTTQCGEWAASPSTDGLAESPFDSAPCGPTLIRDSDPPSPERCSTKMSEWPLPSPRTRLFAELEKAKYVTRRLSWLNEPPLLGPLALRLTTAVARVPLTSACATTAPVKAAATANAQAKARRGRKGGTPVFPVPTG